MKELTTEALEQLEAAEGAFKAARARAREAAWGWNSCMQHERISWQFAKAEEEAAYAELKKLRAKFGIG